MNDFEGMNDSGLRLIKMKVLLVQHALKGAIEGEVSPNPVGCKKEEVEY